jgi:hypothetical protein
MTYTVADITELIRHHLVFGASDSSAADNNLRLLTHEVEAMVSEPLWTEAQWLFCDFCGTSVDTVLIHPDGHHYSDDGDFYCQDCWETTPWTA